MHALRLRGGVHTGNVSILYWRCHERDVDSAYLQILLCFNSLLEMHRDMPVNLCGRGVLVFQFSIGDA